MFPVRCECNRVIGNKYLTYEALTKRTYVDAHKKSGSDLTIEEWCQKHLKMSMDEISKIPSPHISLIHPEYAFRLLNIPVSQYCCRSRFLTYVDMPVGRPYDESHEYVTVVTDTLQTRHVCVAR
jgi:DNA-directed RNA polymerase subunit N (RpoN/RPB10)